jgi:iron complex transport system substrate-binding protein
VGQFERRGIPKKIICLTEESVETLHCLGLSEHIAGVSIFVKRPLAAMEHPRVCSFTSAQTEKILALRPDLVLGHSDIQQDVAKELIAHGLDVWIANHRTLEGVLDYVMRLSRLMGHTSEGLSLVDKWQRDREFFQAWGRDTFHGQGPRVYFEEWDEPMISAIQWVVELLTEIGTKPLFSATGHLARERFVDWEQVVMRDPELFLGCWCGKRFRPESVKQRVRASEMTAIRENRLFEVPPEIFLQPGPALFIDGFSYMKTLLERTFVQHP